MYRQVTANWVTGPHQVSLAAGQVDVWRLPLQAPNTTPAELEQQQRYHTVHLAQREVLARYLGCSPGAITLARGANGKPFIDAPSADLHFNLSHTAATALLAVGATPLGVDVEHERPVRQLMRVARRALPTADVEALAALPPEQRNAVFLQLWTRMEARQKAAGSGIFAPAAPACDFSNFSFVPGAGLYASLSVAQAPGQIMLRFFAYRPMHSAVSSLHGNE